MTETEFMPFWNLLCEAKGRVPSAPLTRIYAVIVKEEGISAEQWARACTAAIRFNEFMPTPQALIDLAVGQDFKVQALNTWDRALDASINGRRSDLDDEARRIMNNTTNGVPLGQLETRALPWAKKEFVERYAARLSEEAIVRTPALLPPVATQKELTINAAD